jgi:uncharacterized membrane protein YfcA
MSVWLRIAIGLAAGAAVGAIVGKWGAAGGIAGAIAGVVGIAVLPLVYDFVAKRQRGSRRDAGQPTHRQP